MSNVNNALSDRSFNIMKKSDCNLMDDFLYRKDLKSIYEMTIEVADYLGENNVSTGKAS